MLFVFRGTRPRTRTERYDNFDNYLLGRAIEEGAQVITGEVKDIAYSPADKPLVTYRVFDGVASTAQRWRPTLSSSPPASTSFPAWNWPPIRSSPPWLA